MSKSIVLDTVTNVINLYDLLAVLQRMAVQGVESLYPPSEIHVFNHDGEPLRVRLIVDILTDGSKVYNVNIE